MRVGILTIGNELLSGRTQDTNSALIASHINARGWQVSMMMSVGDDYEAVKRELDHILNHADAVIVTGGLGPTADDITTAAIARACGLGLYTDENVLAEIKARFVQHGLVWTMNNTKQAMFPEGARLIANPIGTAWGFALKHHNKRIIVIPGVPSEVARMMPKGVIPVLREAQTGPREFFISRTFKLFGITEAKLDETVAHLNLDDPELSIGFYPRFPESHLVLTSKSASDDKAKSAFKDAEFRIAEALKKYIFGFGDDTIEGIVAELLSRKKLTLSVAESCTGGRITDKLTNIPGSSQFLERGFVTYSNESKTKLLGVPSEVIRKFGAVSEETARSMAEGARNNAGTDIAISVTGIAGPTGGTEAKPVGTVYIALADGKQTVCRLFRFRWERQRIKEMAAHWALEMLRRYLTEGNPCE